MELSDFTMGMIAGSAATIFGGFILGGISYYLNQKYQKNVMNLMIASRLLSKK